MTTKTSKMGQDATPRTVRFPGSLWDRVGRAARLEAIRLDQKVTEADIVRQGAAQRVDEILGAEDAPDIPHKVPEE